VPPVRIEENDLNLGTQVRPPRRGTCNSASRPDGGYAPNGNILAHSDSVMGDWLFSYDTLDRLTTSTGTSSMTTLTDPEVPATYAGMYHCWNCGAGIRIIREDSP
jgi:hypothetical protein